MDRGGDREEVLKPLLEGKHAFLIEGSVAYRRCFPARRRHRNKWCRQRAREYPQ